MATQRPKATLRPKGTGSAAIQKMSDTGLNEDGGEKEDSREPKEEGGGGSTDEGVLICNGIAFPPSGLTDYSYTGVSLTEFRVFPRLPQELQDRIWMFTAHAEERIVELRFASSYISPRHLFKAIIPAILHTTRRSRTEGLRYYKPLGNEKSANDAYINFCIDYLYIRESRPPGPWDLPPYYDDGCAEQVKLVMPLLPFKNSIKNLAISSTSLASFDNEEYEEDNRIPTILSFPSLEQVTLLCDTTMSKRDHISRVNYRRVEYGSLVECDCYIDTTGKDPVKSQNAIFFSQEELQLHMEHHCGNPTDDISGAQVAINAFMREVIKKKLDATWKAPVFKIGGVMHDHKAKDSFWCLPWESTRVRGTRSKGFIEDY